MVCGRVVCVDDPLDDDDIPAPFHRRFNRRGSRPLMRRIDPHGDYSQGLRDQEKSEYRPRHSLTTQLRPHKPLHQQSSG